MKSSTTLSIQASRNERWHPLDVDHIRLRSYCAAAVVGLAVREARVAGEDGKIENQCEAGRMMKNPMSNKPGRPSKLSAAEKHEVRRYREAGVSIARLASMWHVSTTRI